MKIKSLIRQKKKNVLMSTPKPLSQLFPSGPTHSPLNLAQNCKSLTRNLTLKYFTGSMKLNKHAKGGQVAPQKLYYGTWRR